MDQCACCSSQEALVRESSLLRPGGFIALQEFDSASYECYPEHPSWNLLIDIWNETFHAKGGNEFVGRSLPYLLELAGVVRIEMKVHVETAQIGEYRRTHLLALIESMRASILDSGRIGDAELRQHMRALSEHLANSRFGVRSPNWKANAHRFFLPS